MPPLNDRRDDIPLLVNKFLDDIGREYGDQSFKAITPEAMTYLQQLDWRGNIRELRNVVERLVIMSEGEITEEIARTYAKPA